MNSETIILHLMQIEGVGARTLNRLLRTLNAENRSVEYLIKDSPAEIADRYGLPPGLCERINSDFDEAAALYEELQSNDVRVVLLGSRGYPERLSTDLDNLAPPALFLYGDPDLLRRPSAAICGSRNATPIGLDATATIASHLANRGVNIVSGFAPGVDQAAHRAAIEAGGVTTVVLPRGILSFRLNEISDEVGVDNHLLVISEFHPRSPWTTWGAMQRNNTIIGLADLVIGVEPATSGGTFEACRAALRMGRPLYLPVHAQADQTMEGNRYFLRRGAEPIQFNGESQAELDQCFGVLQKEHQSHKNAPADGDGESCE